MIRVSLLAAMWGSVGAWYSGRWHDDAAEGYIATVKQALADRTWRSRGFRRG